MKFQTWLQQRDDHLYNELFGQMMKKIGRALTPFTIGSFELPMMMTLGAPSPKKKKKHKKKKKSS